MEVFADLVQGEPEWHQAKLGLVSASVLKEVRQKPGPRDGIPKGRQTLMWKLAGEIITGEPRDSFTNDHMARGHEREGEARELYAFLRDVEPVQVGGIRNGDLWVSPDALIGKDGMYENKNAAAHIQIERLLKGEVPPEHIPQIQGQLMGAERQWVDFMSYCRGLPPLIIRVDRDEKYIAELRVDVDDFVSELNALVSNVRSM